MCPEGLYMDGGTKVLVIHFSIIEIFGLEKNTFYTLQIAFTFHTCPCSSTPVKYEHDIQQVTLAFLMILKERKNKGMGAISLVTQTHTQEWQVRHPTWETKIMFADVLEKNNL